MQVKCLVSTLKRYSSLHPKAACALVDLAASVVRHLICATARLYGGERYIKKLWQFNLKFMYVANDISRIRNERAEADSHELGRPYMQAPPKYTPGSMDRKVKVVQYIGSLNAGGAERQLCNLSLGLPRNEFDNQVLTSTPLTAGQAHYRSRLEAAGIHPAYTGEVDSVQAKRVILRNMDLLKLLHGLPNLLNTGTAELLVALQAETPDILHAWLDQTNLCAAIAGGVAGIPVIILSTRNVTPEHLPYLSNVAYKYWYRMLADTGRFIFINNSQAGAADYADWLDLPRQAFHVIPNGVDLARLTRATESAILEFKRDLGLGEEDPLIAGVFRFSEEKRPMTFISTCIRAMSRLPRLVAVVVGTGPLEQEMKEYIKKSGCEGRFRFLDIVQDVSTLLSAADVLLHASRYEGTPNVLLEAQALGCPVVATRAGGTVDAVQDQLTGILVEVDDLEALFEALMRVLLDGDLRSRLGKAGIDFIKSRYSLEQMVDKTVEVYQRELQKQQPRNCIAN